MRILDVICTTDSESGGPIEAVERISEVLMRDGHDVVVVSLETQEEAARRKYSFPCTGIGVGPGIGRYRFNPALDHWLRRNAGGFDAVIAHGVWNYTSAAVWRTLRKHRTPYFVFTHGMLDPWFRDHFPIKHIFKSIYWKLVEGRVLRDARAVLFTCEEERLRARNVYPGHAYREQVVLYGTAAPRGNPASESAAFIKAFPGLQGRRFLLFISRIHVKKGCDLLIDAFAECLAEMPQDLDLVIAGPDQAGLTKELQAQAERRGVAGRIHWTGMLKGELKWGAFRNADAMILPSHQENFGFVVAEAMACKKPVLISDKVNIWREVLASNAGVVEPDTLDGTCNLLRRFVALSTEDRVQMGENSAAGFAQYFDIQTTARSLVDTIRALCPEPAEPPQDV